MKLIAMLVFLFVVSCANKPNATFVLEIPHTYEEGLKYLDGAKRYKMGEQKRGNL